MFWRLLYAVTPKDVREDGSALTWEPIYYCRTTYLFHKCCQCESYLPRQPPTPMNKTEEDMQRILEENCVPAGWFEQKGLRMRRSSPSGHVSVAIVALGAIRLFDSKPIGVLSHYIPCVFVLTCRQR